MKEEKRMCCHGLQTVLLVMLLVLFSFRVSLCQIERWPEMPKVGLIRFNKFVKLKSLSAWSITVSIDNSII